MKNCRVTEFEAVVNNDSLPKYGCGYLTVNSTVISSIRFSSGTKVKTLGGGEMSYSSNMSSPFTEATIAGDFTVVYFSAGNYKVEINGKYAAVAKVYLAVNSFIHLEDSLKNWVFNVFNDEVSSRNYNVSDINNGTIQINIGKTNLTGSLSDLSVVTSLQIINFNTAGSVTGSITSVAQNIGLAELQLESTQVTGTVEGFAQAQVSAGRVSGTCKVKVGGTPVTYNGSTVSTGTTLTITYNSSLPNGYSIS